MINKTATGNAPLNMVLIPGGTNRGENVKGLGEFNEEWQFKPFYRRSVRTFYMDRYEVTKAKWAEVYLWACNNGYKFDNNGYGVAPDHPVVAVNWYDCVKWCNARSEMAGQTPVYRDSWPPHVHLYKEGVIDPMVDEQANGFRLPTEAEWEYAARGGLSGKRFPWGDTIDHDKANYFGAGGSDHFYGDWGYKGRDTRFAISGAINTSPVGAFEAGRNDYGLFDMSGNVSEWCFDWAPDELWNHDGESRVSRIHRGGCFACGAQSCRVAHRCRAPLYEADYFIGFRCVANMDAC